MTRLTEPGLIGIAIDSTVKRADAAVSLARLADAHRVDFVSAPDHPYLPDELDSWTLLTLLAGRTDHVAITPNVASLALRPPAMLAKAAASLQVLTDGRVVLGVGAGGPLEEIASFGGPRLTVGESVSALEDGLRLIRRAWQSATDGAPAQQGAHHDGPFYRLGVDRFGPVPAQPVPIWVGAFGPRMLALTGRIADGWLPTNAYLELADVPAMQRRVDVAAEAADRDPACIRRVFNVMGTISDSQPVQNGRRLVGPSALWVDVLRDYRDRLGFDSFVFWAVGGDRLAQTQRFLEEVRPELGPEFQRD